MISFICGILKKKKRNGSIVIGNKVMVAKEEGSKGMGVKLVKANHAFDTHSLPPNLHQCRRGLFE